MADCQVSILAAAWEDIERIADYHLQNVGTASAQRITDALLDAIAGLAAFPYMGALHPDPVLARMGCRKLLYGDYVCVYRVAEDMVLIYRVVHGATDYPKLFSSD